MLHGDKSINMLELNLYEKLFNQLNSTATSLSAVVHVPTSPQLCAARIVERSRAGEDHIPVEYLEMLDKYQSCWLASIPSEKKVKTSSEMGESDILQVEEFIKKLLL